MSAIIQHSKNLVLYYGYHTGVVLLKASNSNDIIWIDFEDFVRVKNHTWHVNSKGYLAAQIDCRYVELQRFITSARKGIIIDHKNGKKLDNRKSNLREATKSQNQHNRGKQINNTSGFKGVHWNKRDRKWQAYINYTNNGVKNHLAKYFNTCEEAARQYNEWARQYHREFATLNDI